MVEMDADDDEMRIATIEIRDEQISKIFVS